MSNVKILAFAGSTREGSFNKILLRTAVRGAESAAASVTVIDLDNYRMPIYDSDLEAESGLPENAKKLQSLFLEHNGLLIAAPEYNSSVTPVLKNTIDWVTRWNGAANLRCFAGKTAGIMAAGGGAGGLRGLVHLRQILGNIGVLVLPGQATVSGAWTAFDDGGDLIDEGHRSAVESVGASLAETLIKLHA